MGEQKIELGADSASTDFVGISPTEVTHTLAKNDRICELYTLATQEIDQIVLLGRTIENAVQSGSRLQTELAKLTQDNVSRSPDYAAVVGAKLAAHLKELSAKIILDSDEIVRKVSQAKAFSLVAEIEADLDDSEISQGFKKLSALAAGFRTDLSRSAECGGASTALSSLVPLLEQVELIQDELFCRSEAGSTVVVSTQMSDRFDLIRQRALPEILSAKKYPPESIQIMTQALELVQSMELVERGQDLPQEFSEESALTIVRRHGSENCQSAIERLEELGIISGQEQREAQRLLERTKLDLENSHAKLNDIFGSLKWDEICQTKKLAILIVERAELLANSGVDQEKLRAIVGGHISILLRSDESLKSWVSDLREFFDEAGPYVKLSSYDDFNPFSSPHRFHPEVLELTKREANGILSNRQQLQTLEVRQANIEIERLLGSDVRFQEVAKESAMLLTYGIVHVAQNGSGVRPIDFMRWCAKSPEVDYRPPQSYLLRAVNELVNHGILVHQRKGNESPEKHFYKVSSKAQNSADATVSIVCQRVSELLMNLDAKPALTEEAVNSDVTQAADVSVQSSLDGNGISTNVVVTAPNPAPLRATPSKQQRSLEHFIKGEERVLHRLVGPDTAEGRTTGEIGSLCKNLLELGEKREALLSQISRLQKLEVFGTKLKIIKGSSFELAERAQALAAEDVDLQEFATSCVSKLEARLRKAKASWPASYSGKGSIANHLRALDPSRQWGTVVEEHLEHELKTGTYLVQEPVVRIEKCLNVVTTLIREAQQREHLSSDIAEQALARLEKLTNILAKTKQGLEESKKAIDNLGRVIPSLVPGLQSGLRTTVCLDLALRHNVAELALKFLAKDQAAVDQFVDSFKTIYPQEDRRRVFIERVRNYKDRHEFVIPKAVIEFLEAALLPQQSAIPEAANE